MFGILDNRISETSPYPSCPRHAHHTVTVRDWLHLYLNCSICNMLMSIAQKMTHRSISCEKSPRALIDQWEPLTIFYQTMPLMSISMTNNEATA